MKVVALIPARGGSKSIPYKNIKIIGGKPLIYWTCLAAKESKLINEVYLSTEDKLISYVAESLNLGVKLIERPMEFATDTASTESVMLDFMERVDFDILVTIQATSPMTSTKNLDEALTKFSSKKYDSMVTGVLVKRFFWTVDGKPLNYDYLFRPRRQDFVGTVMENGAFYITKRQVLEEYKNRLGRKIGVYIMPEDTAVEIDEVGDWLVVDKLLRKRIINFEMEKIKIIITDFDGVWTNNKVLTDDEGRELVLSSKEDSLGLDYYRQKSKLPVLVVSREKNGVVNQRCKKLKLPILSPVQNKVEAISEELIKRQLNWHDVCYIGNDLNDLEVMKKSGISFCPADATSGVKEIADFVLQHNGGDGAMREFLNLFLD